MLRDARHCGEHITNRQFVFVSVLALAKFFLCKSTLRSFGNPICPSCRCLGIGNQPLWQSPNFDPGIPSRMEKFICSSTLRTVAVAVAGLFQG
jgi:hypothetical protein